MANYAVYRKQRLKQNKELSEGEIYKEFLEIDCGQWNIQTEPKRGKDGKYHYLYILPCSDGSVYFGKHSDEGYPNKYEGSGKELEPLRKEGKVFLTPIPLEFTKTSAEAYAREEEIVNQQMIAEAYDTGVLNRTVGGQKKNWQKD